MVVFVLTHATAEKLAKGLQLILQGKLRGCVVFAHADNDTAVAEFAKGGGQTARVLVSSPIAVEGNTFQNCVGCVHIFAYDLLGQLQGMSRAGRMGESDAFHHLVVDTRCLGIVRAGVRGSDAYREHESEALSFFTSGGRPAAARDLRIAQQCLGFGSVFSYAETNQCRRAYICSVLGEDDDNVSRCGKCDNCVLIANGFDFDTGLGVGSGTGFRIPPKCCNGLIIYGREVLPINSVSCWILMFAIHTTRLYFGSLFFCSKIRGETPENNRDATSAPSRQPLFILRY